MRGHSGHGRRFRTFVKVAAGGPAADMYDYWAQAILSDMAFGRTLLTVGTLRLSMSRLPP